MYIKRGTGCKYRQTLKFFNFIPIYHDFDAQKQYKIDLRNDIVWLFKIKIK